MYTVSSIPYLRCSTIFTLFITLCEIKRFVKKKKAREQRKNEKEEKEAAHSLDRQNSKRPLQCVRFVETLRDGMTDYEC